MDMGVKVLNPLFPIIKKWLLGGELQVRVALLLVSAVAVNEYERLDDTEQRENKFSLGDEEMDKLVLESIVKCLKYEGITTYDGVDKFITPLAQLCFIDSNLLISVIESVTAIVGNSDNISAGEVQRVLELLVLVLKKIGDVDDFEIGVEALIKLKDRITVKCGQLDGTKFNVELMLILGHQQDKLGIMN